MSDDLTENFKTGHQSIVDILDRTQGVVRSYSVAKPNIREMSKILLAHFGRQDKEFFDKLHSFYQSDRQATKMIESLIHDLKDTKVKYLVFFDKYSGEMGDIGSNNFPRDFIAFAHDILGRIKIEEDYLLPLIEKLP